LSLCKYWSLSILFSNWSCNAFQSRNAFFSYLLSPSFTIIVLSW